MKEAHTIVRVPPSIERIPAYVRRQGAQPKVKIGAAYRPPMRVQPAVTVYEPPVPLVLSGPFRWLLAMLAAVLIYALCATRVDAAPGTPEPCVTVAGLVRTIAEERDRGTPQSMLIRITLDSNISASAQSTAIRIIDQVYNDQAMSQMPPQKLAAAVMLECQRRRSGARSM